MNLSDHFLPAELLQLHAELDAHDRAFRRKVWAVIGCGLAAFWIVVGAVVWGVW